MSKVIGYKPHTNQRVIHESIREDKAKYYVLNIGRQFGKTLLCTNQMLDWAINKKGCSIGWVSPIYKQSKKVYKELKRATEKSGLFEYNDTDLIVSGFGSSIQFFSAERPDGIRGFTFDYLICDEFDYMKPGIWQEVLQPTVLVKGKKVVFISTPRGRREMFRLKNLSHTDSNYKYFHFTSYDNPMIRESEIDQIRTTVPEHIFKQEYLAEFVDNVSGVFKNVRDSIRRRELSGKLYGGLDIGRADDYTVLTIGDANGMIKRVERWRHDEWTNIIDKVATIINQESATVYVEVNNQGDVFYEMLKAKVGNKIHPFTTTVKSKPEMIEGLAVSFEQHEISLPNEEWLIDELEAFTYIYDPKQRKVKYSAPDGVHDDGVMSVALFDRARNELRERKVNM